MHKDRKGFEGLTDASNPDLGEIRDALQGKGEWRPQLTQLSQLTRHIGEDAANGAMGEREAFERYYFGRTYAGTWNAVRDGEYVIERVSDAWRAWQARAALPAEKVAAEPVAWMTTDGRIATDETKNDAMANSSKAAFCIPLFAAPQQPAQSAEQDERAAFLSGRDVEELFLRWSEWTTELGEAISRKNIDGFVSDLRALLAAQPVSGADHD
jgi:hypothetical protein